MRLPIQELQDAVPFITQLRNIECTDINTAAPELEELMSTIRKLKNGKAASDVPSIFIKSAMKNKKFQNE